jgi:putative ABC transport system substrate-binding protein
LNAARRATLAALACAALLPAVGAPRPPKRLALVHFGNPDDWKDWVDPFVKHLGQLGFVAGGEFELLQVGLNSDVAKPGPEAMARQVEERVLPLRPDLIVTTGPILTYILSLATRTVPVVTQVPDPVSAGFANSLAKPGGNMTGLADSVEETSVKVVEIMKRLLPRLSRLAIFTESRPGAVRFGGYFERAARSAGIEPVTFRSNDDAVQMAALRGLTAKGIQAGMWAWGQGHPRKAGEAALAARVPLFAPDEVWVRHGCLAAYYGFEPAPQQRMAATAALILRGASPAEIPFQLPQHFRLAINRRTADALGIAVPQDLLLRADRVFE